ncbi:alpha/beta fold hydrolase [Streptacidiphilus sp. EB129]|uniref:alpha/beta hydrolase family protein n=1 Tax=Streptacidiphilus sp. EB129 TaxID=3156262 RepID=UPI003518ACE7
MRWGRAAVLVAASAVGAGAAALIVGRVVSDLSVRPRGVAPAAADGLRVHSVAAGQVELTRAWETQRPGRYALEWPGGRAVVGEVLQTDPQSVYRRLESTEGATLTVGTAVRITPQVYRGDPRSALGLDFTEARVRGELGPMPAWYLPGVRDLVVIAVHGPGGDRQQTLPLLPLLSSLKVPVLVVTYRNDEGAPRSPDGLGHFGETEWRDVEAAIRLAVDGGATRVLLYGWSVGATMVLQAAARSAWRETVRGLVLDSPVLDWQSTVRRQATRRGVPTALAELGARAAEGRSQVDPAGIDRLALGDDLDVPVLLLHGTDDTVAPVAASRRLARRREDLVLYQEFPEAEHEALWNTDPARYEEVLNRFLTPLL